MRKQRYIPFGYQFENGIYQPHGTEENWVKTIFEQYLDGCSYKQLAEYLNSMDCHYSESSPTWNKNMVGRILQDKRYLGNERFPKFITIDQYEQALHLQQQKCTTTHIKKDPVIQAVKSLVRCSDCGNVFTRLLDTRVAPKWYCSKGCKYHLKITDATVLSQIITLLNRLISNPTEIVIQTEKHQPNSLEITRIQNEINRELDKRDCDEEKVRSLILQAAVEKYKLCDDGSRERTGQRLRAVFEAAEPLTELDTIMLESTVSKIFVDSSGTVTLELQNNQIIGDNRQENE